VLGQELMLHALQYAAVDSRLIPTGELKSVIGTPLDFTHPTPIGLRLKAAGGEPIGYDHHFVVEGQWDKLRWVARVTSPKSGRRLAVYSTEPGVRFSSGDSLDGSVRGKLGRVYPPSGGFCLETEHFPDSINYPNFPPTILRPGVTYHSTTLWRFSAEEGTVRLDKSEVKNSAGRPAEPPGAAAPAAYPRR
jgi:aldose 1-epimerase